MTSDPHPVPGEERWSAFAAEYPGEGTGPAASRSSLIPAPSRPEENIWARRISVVVLVLFCLELGLVLMVLPWTRLWVDNNLLLNYPGLRNLAGNAFVRGAFSGLGLLDLWIGVWEAFHYRENEADRA